MIFLLPCLIASVVPKHKQASAVATMFMGLTLANIGGVPAATWLGETIGWRMSCAPGTLETLSRFSILSRLKEPENSSIYSKMRVYDGESLKDTDPKAKSYQEYRDYAGVDEGMNGLSTRFAFKILSRVFNFDHVEA